MSAPAHLPPAERAPPITVISPAMGWRALQLGELWQYRELLYFLVWRDVKVRYKQTVLGAAWAILQPVSTMVIFSVFFGRLARVPSDGLPYPVFSLTALVPWTFFATGLTQSANSVVASQSLITKVYFPRLAIPTSAVLSGLVDFALAFAVLVVVVLAYGVEPRWTVVWVTPLLLLALVTALGAGLWLSALSVKYRDVRHVLPFLTQLWLFATPIAYPSTLLSEPWRTVYALNPMVGVAEGFRWALLGSGRAPGAMLAASTSAALVVLVSGAYYFRRVERGFADIV
jgi:lipopolysaccharide transport system permease protein